MRRFIVAITKCLIAALLCTLFSVPAAATIAPVAVFPLQDVSKGRNGIDMDFTNYLVDRLEKGGTNLCKMDTVIDFMANNRIRKVGQLETYHINLVREELGAAFVLLGTVVQNKRDPTYTLAVRGRVQKTFDVSLGLTLTLVRTFDGRTIWSYSGAFNSAELRHMFNIGSVNTIGQLQTLLGDEIMRQWPLDILGQEQKPLAAIDSITLEPKQLVPGAEVHCLVRLRNRWLEGRAPRGFFKADDQIYAASFSPVNNSYEASWIVGDKDGRYPVTLILEWPLYGRMENVQVGDYLVDGVPPLLNLELKGETMVAERPIFTGNVFIVSHFLVRKPIDRWHLVITNLTDDLVMVDQTSHEPYPEVLTWNRRNVFGDLQVQGLFEVLLEVWDKTGNQASASKQFEVNTASPTAVVTAGKEGKKVTVDLKNNSKVPLSYWRLEMWSQEGKLLTSTEGKELPAKIGLELPKAEGQELEGTLILEDILGNKSRQYVEGLLRAPEKKKKVKVEEKTATKAWVNEF